MVDYCIHLLYVHAAELALLFPFFGINKYYLHVDGTIGDPVLGG